MAKMSKSEQRQFRDKVIEAFVMSYAVEMEEKYRRAAQQYKRALADRVDAAAADPHPAPTEAQKEANNYRQGHVTIQGLPIAIEVPRGGTRRGVGSDGKVWARVMLHHYGRIKRTKGNDNEPVDVFIGPQPDSEIVFVVDQLKPNGRFDESKVLLGFINEAEARKGYLAHYPAGWKCGPVTALLMSDFKRWLEDGDMKEPLSEQHYDEDLEAMLYAEDAQHHWHGQGGKFAPKGTADQSAPEQPSQPAAGQQPEPSLRATMLQHFHRVGQAAGAAEHAARGGVDAVVGKLPVAVQHMVRGATQVLFASYTAAQKAVEAVAKERGLSDKQVATVTKAVCVADVIAGGKLFPMGLAALGLPPGIVAAGGFVPVASIGYLALSTAQDPLSTLRAARKAVASAMGGDKQQPGKYAAEPTPVNVDLIEELVRRAVAFGDAFDEYLACFLTAMEEMQGDTEEAFGVADRAVHIIDDALETEHDPE